jgi:hypothetical protein
VNTTVPGIGYEVRDEDIITYDPGTGTWSMYFDASDVGIGTSDLDAFHIRNDGSILMSFSSALTVPGITGGPNGELVEESDVFLFTPTSTGDNTAGAFSFYFDGSDVGLDSTSEDVVGLYEFSDGSLGISTSGSPSGAGIPASRDEDVLRFSGVFGFDTIGTWTLYFDGSDAGLGNSGDDLDAITFAANTDMLFSTKSPFTTSQGTADDEDVLRFTGTYGLPTIGTINLETVLSTLGIDPTVDLDGLHAS